MDEVYELEISDGYAKFVLLTIAKHVDDNHQGWPSADRISKLTGISRTTVFKKIKWLGENGYLGKDRRWTQDGRPTSNLYTVFSSARGGRKGCARRTPVVRETHSNRSVNISSNISSEKHEDKLIDWSELGREVIKKERERWTTKAE